jgi:hypothetical protein
LNDDQLNPPYASATKNDTNGWVEIGVELLRPSNGRVLPFQMFGNRFKSSSEDSELFVHDPLAQMQAAPGDLAKLNVASFRGEDLDMDLEQLRDRWHVTTYVANHHRGLNRIYSYALLVVGPDGLHLTIYKDFERAA